MKKRENQTIYSLATPPGVSAIAIIRISGPLALDVPRYFFCKKVKSNKINFRRLKDKDGSLIDEVIIISFLGPSSPTGENVLEIHCHGSEAVIKDILNVLEGKNGLQLAEPGEFTLRSFNNGKIDLTMAEGLSDLFYATTTLQRRQATAQISGKLSKPVTKWKNEIISLLSNSEALIDFYEEDLPKDLINKILEKRERIIKDIKEVLNDGFTGEIIRNGLIVTIIGPVNSGKSTALNLLARRPVAIVSNIVGTTRDLLEATININGVPVQIIDTAGFREKAGLIEKEGIKKAVKASKNADINLIVIDGSKKNWKDKIKGFSKFRKHNSLIIVNKKDRGIKGEIVDSIDDIKIVYLSLNDKKCRSILENYISSFIAQINIERSSTLITRSHHRENLKLCLKHLSISKKIKFEDDLELISEEFRLATKYLGKITGHVDVEDLLDEIFSSFCIGK